MTPTEYSTHGKVGFALAEIRLRLALYNDDDGS